MKNITFSADEKLIAQARRVAAERHTTLNAMFRDWLEDVAGREERRRKFEAAMERTTYFHVDRKFTREEMNQR